MASLLGQFVRNLALLAVFIFVAACSTPKPLAAAPFAAYVMDARTGETLYEKNADARLHPASLTKMMTLYIAFEAIEHGEISLDTLVTISKHAAAEPPSKLGLKPGQKIALRHLIRAAAIKSANDAATAIGEAIGGSEDKFAARMNRTAKAIGMKSSSFRNANGLTRDGHMSTARDMSTLGRRLFYDFPQYYNIFSRRETDAGVRQVASTNRRFLDSYKGADGIKTGFTNAAGFNLTASAERGNTRIIATVLGGTSTAARNAKMVELLDLGFAKAPKNAATKPPAAPAYTAPESLPPVMNTNDAVQDALIAEAEASGQPVLAAKTLRVNTAVAKSLLPKARPSQQVAQAIPEITPPAPAIEAVAAIAEPSEPKSEVSAVEIAVADMQDDIFGALAEAIGTTPEGAPTALAETVLEDETTPVEMAAEVIVDAESVVTLASANAAPKKAELPPETLQVAPAATPLFVDASPASFATPTAPEVVTRISTSGGRHWGVNIGRFGDRGTAERALMKTMLSESATLNDGLRKIVQKKGGYDANFMGLSQDQADLACRRLQARGTQCFTIGP